MLPLPENHSVNYKTFSDDDVVLSEKEIEIAIKNAKSVKAAKLRELAYIEALKKPIVYPTITTGQLGIIIHKYAKTIIENFELDEYSREIFKLLCQYFTKDLEFETNGYSLKKGLFLFGNIGCGKTTMFKLFQRNVTNDFYVKSCREVASEYTKYGVDTIEKYSNLKDVYPHEHYGQKVQGVCFDDLGSETNKKNFGNEINVMEDIIQNRYDRGLIGKTHLTSNLSADEITEAYGSRVASRMREMFNIISFDEKAPDRRN